MLSAIFRICLLAMRRGPASAHRCNDRRCSDSKFVGHGERIFRLAVIGKTGDTVGEIQGMALGGHKAGCLGPCAMRERVSFPDPQKAGAARDRKAKRPLKRAALDHERTGTITVRTTPAPGGVSFRHMMGNYVLRCLARRDAYVNSQDSASEPAARLIFTARSVAALKIRWHQRRRTAGGASLPRVPLIRHSNSLIGSSNSLLKRK
jgi:hypothetical protein